MSRATHHYAPIADYAVIGDCHTAALVSRDGSIDWCCPGRFDSDAVFWRLLDAAKGGFFQVRPLASHRAHRRYRGATNILETTFEVEGGALLRVTDFMPIHRRQSSRFGHDVGTTSRIVRLLEVEGGEVQAEAIFKPAFEFGQARTEVEAAPGKGAIGHAGGQYLTLQCPAAKASLRNNVWRGELLIRPGERVWLALSLTADRTAAEKALGPSECTAELELTASYWEDWAARCEYQGRYRDQVLRSALALKLLIYEPTGAVVAAPTTSLPETIGAIRNWDYRFTWLRDASLMLYALSTLGYHEEGTDFMAWLARTCGDDPTEHLQIMYAVDGGLELPERLLKQLDGYKASRPVRTGNAAYKQLQLDVFGDVLSAAYHFHHSIEKDSRTPVRPAHDQAVRQHWPLLSQLAQLAAAEWQKPDSGIWESRGGPQQFVYSKLMCWTALDRAIRLAEEEQLDGPIQHWRQVRETIKTAILDRGFNDKIGSFTQCLDDDQLDAGVLAMPRFGFLPATDHRVQSTIAAIQTHLGHNGLIKRYAVPPKELGSGSEATFVLCSFWMVDALAMSGRVDEARDLFHLLLSQLNDVGLLSEEIDPASGTDRLLGNFPQGFSHMALIGSAVNLALASRRGADTAAQTEPERAAEAASAAADQTLD